MPGAIETLWPQAHEVMRDVDCILHAGDLHTTAVIDELNQWAPTYVSRGNGDVDIDHPQLRDTWMLDLGGVSVGLVHHFPSPARASEAKIAKHLNKNFTDQIPQVLVYGHTHQAGIHYAEHTIYVNPGSPTLPNNQATRLGTLGVMTIRQGKVDIVLYQLCEDGVIPLGESNSVL